jgi:hypothetical protein
MEQLTQLEAELDVEDFDRRTSPRLEDHVSYNVALTSAPALDAAGGDVPKLVGHTRDLSEGGFALIVPSLTFAYRHLLSPDFKLRLTLELPSGPVEIEGVPTNDRPLRDADGDMHYMLSGEFKAAAGLLFYGYEDNPRDSACILGVRITAMSDDDRALYAEHLRSLGLEGSPTPPSRAQGGVGTARQSGVQPEPKRIAVDFWTWSNRMASEYSYF